MSVVVIHWTDRTRLPLRIDTDQFAPELTGRIGHIWREDGQLRETWERVK